MTPESLWGPQVVAFQLGLAGDLLRAFGVDWPPSVGDIPESVSPPDETSDAVDVLAWQVYHAILKLARLSEATFVFGR